MANADAGPNQVYFDKAAAEYDTRFQAVLDKLEGEIRAKVGVIGFRQGGRLLDYACGTGLLPMTLGPHLSQCIGVDVSKNMVDAFNAKARSRGLAADQCSAHVFNLMDAAESWPPAFAEARFEAFDVAGVGMGFHHFVDCGLAARRLAERLRPGGVLFVVDFVSHNAHGMAGAVARGVHHHGFAEDQIRAIFETAGVGRNFAFCVVLRDVVFSRTREDGGDMVRTVFLARGEKS